VLLYKTQSPQVVEIFSMAGVGPLVGEIFSMIRNTVDPLVQEIFLND
jgi:hypothetical protein